MRWFLSVFLLCLSVITLPAAAASLLDADFERDPAGEGWITAGRADDQDAPRWVEAADAPAGPHALTARTGYWASPLLPVTPGAYYRIDVSVKAEGNGYWHAWCYRVDAEKPETEPAIISGTCSQLEAADAWAPREMWFRADRDITHCRVVFQPLKGKPIWVDGVSVRPVERHEVVACQDAVYAAMPPLTFTPAKDRWQHLPATKRALQRGQPLRVVMLGDSNVNDIASSDWHLLVERASRGARLETTVSVIGSTGCWYYKEPEHLKAYVLDHQPDLLVIGGISHKEDIESIRAVIRGVRAASKAEVLLMTGTAPRLDPATEKPWTLAVDPAGTNYRSKLSRLASEEKVAYLDLCGPFFQYVAVSGKGEWWFYRDTYHFNDRGKQALARILAAYFTP